jgi:hypothetical protein
MNKAIYARRSFVPKQSYTFLCIKRFGINRIYHYEEPRNQKELVLSHILPLYNRNQIETEKEKYYKILPVHYLSRVYYEISPSLFTLLIKDKLGKKLNKVTCYYANLQLHMSLLKKCRIRRIL